MAAVRGPVALTGTPGTGKSSVAARLGPAVRAVEVADLALAVGAGRRRGSSVEVDLPRLRRALRRPGALAELDVVVGHLAHLLPVRSAIVLRCHPSELLARLRRARRGTAADRRENYLCEATDLVLVEALGTGIPVYEIDSTGCSVHAVAGAVRRRLASKGPSRVGVVDWLGDPAVTRQLLRLSR